MTEDLDGIKHSQRSKTTAGDGLDFLRDLNRADGLADDTQSITVILPVTSLSLANLGISLGSLTPFTSQIQGVVVSCPDSILVETRRVVRHIVSTAGSHAHPELSIHSWATGSDQTLGLLHAASHVTTQYLIFLDEYGLDILDEPTQKVLFNAPVSSLPVGPRGVIIDSRNATCLPPSSVPQVASYLVPPFVISSALLQSLGTGTRFLDGWVGLGNLISSTRTDNVGGLVLGYELDVDNWCRFSRDTFLQRSSPISDELFQASTIRQPVPNAPAITLERQTHLVLAVLFPTLQELGLFSAVACRLGSRGYTVRILLYEEFEELTDNAKSSTLTLDGCRLGYDTAMSEDMTFYGTVRREDIFLSDWIDTWDDDPDVVIALAEQDSMTSSLAYILEEIGLENVTLIQMPRADLIHSDWMGSLSATEWSYWHVPQIDISIITNSRPRSLARLVSSLSNSLFFGDKVNLRINLDHPSDVKTLRMVDDFSWEHGDVTVFHRVVHAGLLPAVVESWYPQSNDSYGLLLEDDIEVSPLFYAWTKMAILQYRYGLDMSKSTQLFGISLYQQKNLELGPQGRRPFDAQVLFAEHGLPVPSTPYLSQVPCSWGAVYFPEHWREFHAYLTHRLSESMYPLSQIIVPDVRSNKWKKSWKKYFIEMVYLKGYVMLYPNYNGFVSLSTNHLEMGSHVREVSKEKQDLFLLPLMQLPRGGDPSSRSGVRLMDLPQSKLPAWEALPVVNLTGSMTSIDAQMRLGERRRAELEMCSRHSALTNGAGELVCVAKRGSALVYAAD